MAGLINIGFGNMVNTDKIISIISSDSAPAKRLIQRGKETGDVNRCDTGQTHQECDLYRK